MDWFWTIIQLLIRLLFFFNLRRKNISLILIRNWRIESTDISLKLGNDYLKSISSHIEKLLGWLYGLFLNNYPVTYSFIGFFFYLRRKNITWNLSRNGRIESTWQRLFQEYIKPYPPAFSMVETREVQIYGKIKILNMPTKFWTVIILSLPFLKIIIVCKLWPHLHNLCI